MVQLVAEIGLNHMGNQKVCNKMLQSAIDSKVNGVSIQIQYPEYYNLNKNYKKILSFDFYKKISAELKKKKIEFGVAVVDINTVKNFSKNLKYISFWKILATEFFNNNLIETCLKTGKEVFVSSAFASENEVKKLLKKFNRVKIIHTSLSNKIEDSNILAIEKLKKKLKKKISFGLHCETDIIIPTVIAHSPEKIFFYIKDDIARNYPDNSHALQISSLKNKIKTWKKIETSLGNGTKIKKQLPKWIYKKLGIKKRIGFN